MSERGDWTPSGPRFWIVVAAVVVAGLAVAGAAQPHGLAHALGLDNLSGPFYGYWSGSGGTLEAYARDIILISLLWYHANCHARGCWRWGRYQVEGTPYKVCAHCHMHVPSRGATREEIHQAHYDAKAAGNTERGEA
jgi:hypothetical protein